MTDPYLVLAAELRALRAQKSRSPQLAFSSIEDGSIDENDADGNLVSVVGQQFDGGHGVVTLIDPAPPTPSVPVCEGGAGVLSAAWDGEFLDADGVPDPLSTAPTYWARTSFYASQDAGFVAGGPGLLGTTESPQGGGVTRAVGAGTWFVRSVAWSKSGKPSAPSGLVQVVVEDTVTQANLDAADQRLVDAKAELELADAALTDALADSDADLTAAQVRLDTAENELTAAQDRLDTAETTIANLPVENLTVTGTATIKDAVAQNIAAASGQYIDLDVGQLNVTGTGTFKTAVMDEAFAEMFSTRKLTAGNVLIGSGRNLIPNGSGELGSAVGWDSSLTFDPVDKPEGVAGSFRSAPASGAVEGTTTSFPVEPSTEYLFEIWVKADKPNSLLYVFLQDQSDAFTTNANLPGKPGVASSSFPVSAALVPVIWTKYYAISTTGPNARELRISNLVFNQFGGTERTATVWIAGVSLKSRVDGNLVALGSITAPHIVASESMSAKLAQFLHVTAELMDFVSTDPDGSRMTLTAEGLKIFEPPEQGGMYGDPVVQLSPGDRSIQSGSGGNYASMDKDGVITGTGLSVSGDPEFMGTPLLGSITSFQHPSENPGEGLIQFMPRGMIARGYRDMTDRNSITDGEVELLEFSYRHEPGRAYKIVVSPFSEYVGGGNTYGWMNVYVSSDGTRPQMTDTPAYRQLVRNPGASRGLYTFGGDFYSIGYYPAPTQTYVMVTLSVEGGTLDFYGAESGGALRAWVEDMGLSVPDTSVERNTRRYFATPTAPPPPPPTKKSYTQTWYATGTKSYDGTQTYAYDTTRMYQGSAGYTGDLSAIAIFGNGNLGQSFQSALSSASIESIEVYLYFEHWWDGGGGICNIFSHTAGALDATRPPRYTLRNGLKFSRNQERWINVDKSFAEALKSGSRRGIGIMGSGTSEYGIATGASSLEHRPAVRIKYTK